MNDETVEINNKICDTTCSTDKISPKWLLRIKSSIRPFMTYSWHIYTIIVTAMYFLNKIPVSEKDIVKEILFIETIIIVFWFGERLARNVGIVDLIKNLNTSKKDVQ